MPCRLPRPEWPFPGSITPFAAASQATGYLVAGGNRRVKTIYFNELSVTIPVFSDPDPHLDFMRLRADRAGCIRPPARAAWLILLDINED